MGYKYFTNPVGMVKRIISKYVKDGNIVADCTTGNGNDTILLAKMVGENGKVYGFDIQAIAIEKTYAKLKECGLEERVKLINDGHENIDKHIKQKIHLAVYNLGYLPGGNKKIKTNSVTTLESIKKVLNLLDMNGLLLVTCYIGHPGGLEEKEKVKTYLKSLEQKKFNVIEFNFMNQKNNPPVLYGVEKL